MKKLITLMILLLVSLSIACGGDDAESISCEEAAKLTEDSCKDSSAMGSINVKKCEASDKKDEIGACVEDNKDNCEKITQCLIAVALSK